MADELTDDAVVAVATRWCEADPDPDTRDELRRMIDAGELPALRARFSSPLRFGTAGLRGPLGAGPDRMNRLVVRRAATALAVHLRALRDSAGDGGPGLPVVIGYDARHKSSALALDTARVLAAHDIHSVLFDRAVPTPVVAFAVRELPAVAGVVVTASHNPVGDSGYKVYGADGAQIIPPTDAAIASVMETIDPAAGVAMAATDDVRIRHGAGAVMASYVRRSVETVDSLLPLSSSRTGRPLRVAYTPLHGVGGATLLDVFEAAQLPAPAVVAAQAEPDPDFPTAPVPNPEHPDSLSLLLAEAARCSADIALANDPDADRLSVAVPDSDGGWRRLTGDEVGVLLADVLLEEAPAGEEPPLLVSSVVSSQMLPALARARGAVHIETLTGFKWLARPIIDRKELRPLLAYEEALGYALGDQRDKDGITAALAIVRIATRFRAEGTTIPARLDLLGRELGFHATGQVAIEAAREAAASAVVEGVGRLRQRRPSRLVGRDVVGWRDLLVAEDARGLPAADVLIAELDGGDRIVVRPSGTEPKVKIYAEAVRPSSSAADAAVSALLEATARVIGGET